jgi:hypothetical protein
VPRCWLWQQYAFAAVVHGDVGVPSQLIEHGLLMNIVLSFRKVLQEKKGGGSSAVRRAKRVYFDLVRRRPAVNRPVHAMGKAPES